MNLKYAEQNSITKSKENINQSLHQANYSGFRLWRVGQENISPCLCSAKPRNSLVRKVGNIECVSNFNFHKNTKKLGYEYCVPRFPVLIAPAFEVGPGWS